MSGFAIVDREQHGPAAVIMTFEDREAAEAMLPYFSIRGVRAAIRRTPASRRRAVPPWPPLSEGRSRRGRDSATRSRRAA